jgi:hypothetical protein
MTKTTKHFWAIILFFSFFSALAQTKEFSKPTICILGGTPSSSKIIDEIPNDLKAKYLC